MNTTLAPALSTSKPPETSVHWSRCGVDLMDAIYERRSVRAYAGRKLEPDLVRTLIDAAIQAPSALNLQPWAFVVIQERAFLERLSERAKELALGSLERSSPLWKHRALLHDPAFDVFHGAGTLIVLCATDGLWASNEDCCLAAQNLMLAAHGLGLGTCPIGFARAALNEPNCKAELGIPPGHSAVLAIAVGHPRERPARTPRRAASVLSWR